MATITSSGAGSGLNVNSLVTQLVAAERAPYDTRIARAEAKVTSEFSALATLKGAMSTLQSALGALTKPADFQTRAVSVSDDDFFGAAATADAVPGNYTVEVQQLAKAAQLGSVGISGGATATAGTGTLNISLGASTFSVTLASGENTLADLRDAINASPSNPGVNAALISDVTGTHLVLGSSKTGAVNALRVTSTGGDANLARFVYDPPTTTSMTALATAQDAIVKVSGYEIHDTDNSIDGAIEGVTLSLKKAEIGTVMDLGVSIDNSAIKEKANRFVSAYNVLATQVAKLRSYNAETKVAGPLLGDSMLRGIESQMRRLLTDPVASGGSSVYTTLASLGITTQVDGTLALDATKFDKAMLADPTAASRVFASDSGIAVKLKDYLDDRLASGSELAGRDARLTERTKDIAKQKEALDLRMEAFQARYQKQFTALDSLLTQLQSTSSYLAQQLASLPGASS